MKRSHKLFIQLFWLPACAACQVAEMPTGSDFHEGEQWSWRKVDNLTGEQSGSFGRTVVSNDGHLSFLGTSRRTFGIEDVYRAMAGRRWPLHVGDTWPFRTNWSTGTGEPGSTVFDAEVVAFEMVTVPAGTYEAFRIEYRGNWEMKDYAGRRWTGPVKDVYWYAPAVRADVRHSRVNYGRHGSEQWTIELTGYVPAPR